MWFDLFVYFCILKSKLPPVFYSSLEGPWNLSSKLIPDPIYCLERLIEPFSRWDISVLNLYLIHRILLSRAEHTFQPSILHHITVFSPSYLTMQKPEPSVLSLAQSDNDQTTLKHFLSFLPSFSHNFNEWKNQSLWQRWYTFDYLNANEYFKTIKAFSENFHRFFPSCTELKVFSKVFVFSNWGTVPLSCKLVCFTL